MHFMLAECAFCIADPPPPAWKQLPKHLHSFRQFFTVPHQTTGPYVFYLSPSPVPSFNAHFHIL